MSYFKCCPTVLCAVGTLLYLFLHISQLKAQSPVEFPQGTILAVTGVAHDDPLNLRSQPGVAGAIEEKLPFGTTGLVATGKVMDIGRDKWIEVKHRGRTGWLNARYVRIVNRPAAGDEPKIEVVPQIGHPIDLIAFSPDGQYVLSVGTDREIKLWHVGSGTLLRIFPEDEAKPLGERDYGDLLALTFLDGRTFLSVGGSGTFKIRDVSTGRLIRSFKAHAPKFVHRAMFSTDGRLVLLDGMGEYGVAGRQLELWDVSRERRVRTVHVPDDCYVLTLSSTHLLCSAVARKIDLRDLATGSLIRIFEASIGSFSPDASTVALVDEKGPVGIWDVKTGALVRTFDGHNGVYKAIFSSDGALLLTAGRSAMRVWDTRTGALLRSIERSSPEGSTDALLWAPGGKLIADITRPTVKLWDTITGTLWRSLEGRLAANFGDVSFSADASRVLSHNSNTLMLWDAATGAPVRTIKDVEISSAMLSPDGAHLLSVGGSGPATLKLWDATTGALLRTFGSKGEHSATFSPDGRHILSARDYTVTLRDAATGLEIRVFSTEFPVRNIEYSPDGRYAVLIPYDSDTVPASDRGRQLLDISSGRVMNYLIHGDAFAISTDASRLASSPVAMVYGDPRVIEGMVVLTDVSTGRVLHTIRAHSKSVSLLTFSPDGSRLLSAGFDGDLMHVKHWDVVTGRLIKDVVCQSTPLPPDLRVANAQSGRWFGFSSSNGALRKWDIANCQLLASFFDTEAVEWLALTPEGFFAGSPKGSEVLSVVRGLEHFNIDQLYHALYRPDLVQEKLAGDTDGKVKQAAARLDLGKVMASGSAPQVTIITPKHRTNAGTDEIAVEAAITASSGGIGRIEWRVNGVTLGLEERGLTRVEGAKAAQIVRRVLSLEPGHNKIEVVAYNAKNLIASEPASVTVQWDGETSAKPARLHVLAVGINDYWDSRLRLTYAVPDAKALGVALEKAGAGVYGAGQVNVTILTDAQVTVSNLDRAFTKIANEVRPRDAFALFMAGHGKTLNGRYYFLPHDFRYDGDASLEKLGVSQERLQGWLAQIRARKTVLFFDTCESGSLTGDRLALRGLQRVAALDRLTRAMGRTVISASTDDAPAIEGYRGHGAFTYVLLEGLGAGDVNNNGLIEVGELADYLEAKLPDLTYNIFKLRQVPQRKMVGNNFALVGKAVVLPEGGGTTLRPGPEVARATHVVTVPAAVRQEASGSAALVTELTPGTQVAVIEIAGNWVLVAREGSRLGYVEEKALARLQ